MSLKKTDAIVRALDVLDFDSGDWDQVNIERHLREQIELAKKILVESAEDEDFYPGAVKSFLNEAEELIEEYPFLYVEIARTRSTEWMAWLCSHNKDDHPERVVLASGQGSSADEACYTALNELSKKELEVQS